MWRKRLIKPMRYQCRPGGKPAFDNVKFPSTYNARRDNLEGSGRIACDRGAARPSKLIPL